MVQESSCHIFTVVLHLCQTVGELTLATNTPVTSLQRHSEDDSDDDTVIHVNDQGVAVAQQVNDYSVAVLQVPVIHLFCFLQTVTINCFNVL